MVSEERIKTNLLLMDELDYWDELTVKAINDEWTLRYYNHIMNLLNNQVDESIKWLDSEDARQLFYDEAEYQYGLFQSLEDEWDTILENKYPSIEALLQEVYNRGKAKGYAEMREHIRFSDTDKLALEFVRGYNFHLITKIDKDTRNQIKNTITSAVISGENPRKVAPKIIDTVGTRLEESTFTPMQRAVMISRTEISRAQNTGILQSYINEGYQEVKILTAEDSNVCYTCLSYAYDFNEDTPIIFENHGEEKVQDILKLIKGGMFPPFHPNCRCTYLSIWSSKGEPPEEPYIIDLTPEIDPYIKELLPDVGDQYRFNNFRADENDEFLTIQDELQDALEWLEEEIKVFKFWGGVGFRDINGKIRRDIYFTQQRARGYINIRDINEKIEIIERCIEKAPGLNQDTILFAGAIGVDKNTKIGDELYFKGFQGVSYSKEIGEEYKEKEEERYLFTIMAPKGSKGIRINNTFDGIEREKEWLLQRNQSFKVLDINHEEKTVVVELI